MGWLTSARDDGRKGNKCDSFCAAQSRACILQSLALGAGDVVSGRAFGADAAQLDYTISLLQKKIAVQRTVQANDAIQTITAAQTAVQASITSLDGIIAAANKIGSGLAILDQVVALAAKFAPV
jgi:hypothetical protein